jgi:chromosome segregation protein
MRLKKLTIIGFKSFAEKVVLDFDCEIIGIVGPNGCGKSNIVDAFRWVMGEQSAKSLRGDKMHDLLFAGSDSKKALNYAEVSVTLTEIEGALPIPYEELTITRRLHRSGESEYLINKELVRLKDVQGLFLGSGIGKNAFSVFEQGKLDQIIHLSPIERRIIFDEAANISRFLLRKKETVRKLTSVNENFTRVHDIHAEIEKQAKQLKKQASHAKGFQENTLRLEELEKEVLIHRWKKIEEKNRGVNEKLSSLSGWVKQGQEEIAALEVLWEGAKQRALGGELAAKQQQKELSLCETKLRVQEAEISQQRQSVLETKKREESIQSHLLNLSKEQHKRCEEIEKKEQELKGFIHHLQEAEMNHLRERIKKGREKHLRCVQEEGRLSAELQKSIFAYEAKMARLTALNAFENSHAESLKTAEGKIAHQREKLATLTTHIDAFKEESEQLEKELLHLRKQHSDAQKEESALMRQMTETEGHQKALQRLKEEMEGFSAGAKALLKEAKNEKSPLYQKVEPLFEYLIPHKGYEELLACSMKAYAETLVVASDAEFAELLAFAKKKKIVDFSVIVKTRLKAKKGGGKKGTLFAHVENNLVAYHFTEGFEMAEEGHFYDPLGIFFHVGGEKKSNNTFYRQAELKSFSETLTALQKEVNLIVTSREQIAEKLKKAEKKRSEIFEVRRKKEMDLVQENFSLQLAISELEKLRQEMSSLKKEKESLSRLHVEEREIKQLQEQAQGLKSEGEILAEALKQQEQLLERWQEVHQQVQILKARQQQSAAHEKKMSEQIEELRAHVEATLKAIVRQEEGIELSRVSLKTLQADVQEKERELVEARKGCAGYEKEVGQRKKSLVTHEKEMHALEIVLAQDLSEKKGFEQELEKKGVQSAQVASHVGHLADEGLAETLKEIGHLRATLEAAGAVNMTAIEEFQETQARFDYLDQQLKDLEESKKDLEAITLKLDQESRKIFRKTFQQIRENFQKNFAILFNGGSADLTFTESSDILEAGIEIVAKPPGKQMRSISLLSGGEKCLTALALLFSIFEVRPAPFCILDEVDAPLDDSNIDRFTNVLKQFIDKTQFLIVTHNKKTMAIADLLIGVSMEEKGVSKLISLRLEKTPHSAAALL